MTDLSTRTAEQIGAAVTLVAGDELARELARSTGPAPDPDGPLGAWLYARWWCGVDPAAPVAPAAGSAAPLVPALEAARRRSAPVIPGWLVLACTDGHLMAAALPDSPGEGRPGLVTVPVDTVTGSSRPGMPPRPGDRVDLLGGRSGVRDGTGWWWATTGFSDDGPSREPRGAGDRIYLHTGTGGVADVVRQVLAAARHAGVELWLKCPSDASGYGRRDTVVAYYDRRDRGRMLSVAPDLAAAVTPVTEHDAPPLTERLGRGIGWAEDPGEGISYGQLRCAQVAAVAAELLRGKGLREIDDDTLILVAAARAGIDPAAPHLLAGGE